MRAIMKRALVASVRPEAPYSGLDLVRGRGGKSPKMEGIQQHV